jgi:multidrug resistance efflux pump
MRTLAMTIRYKFVYKKKTEFKTPKKIIFLLSSASSDPTYSLSSDEYELAQLFDGERIAEEVLDQFYKIKGMRLTKEHLQDFMGKLIDARLLQEVEPSAPVSRVPAYRRKLAARSDVPDLHTLEPVIDDLDEFEEFADTEQNATTDEGLDHVDVESRPDESASTTAERKTSDHTTRLTEHTSIDRISHGLGDRARSNEAAENSALTDHEDMERARKFSELKSQRLGPKLIIRLPVAWLLPFGRLLAFPSNSNLLIGLMVAGACLSGYALWDNRVELVRDLDRMFRPLTLAHTLLMSMLTVNLFGQLARAAAYQKYSGKVPPFGIILAFHLLPRFYTDVSDLRSSLQQQRLTAVSLFTTLLLFLIATFGWLISKGGATYLPLLSIGIATLSAFLFLLRINPLGKFEGYHLIAAKLGVPDLRNGALLALFGIRPQETPWSKQISPWALRIYGLAVLIYLITISVLIIQLLGGWLESHWGGLGVLIFLGLVAAVLIDPVRQARAAALRLKQAPHRKLAHRRIGQPRRKVRPIFVFLFVIAVLAGVGSLPYKYEPGGDFVILPTERIDVRALIAGDVREIFVDEGDFVKAKQIVAQLADDEERTNMAGTEAKLAELRAKLAIAEKGAKAEEIALARQRVQTALTRSTFSRNRADRLEGLEEKRLVSRQEYEDALARAEVDAEQLKEARRELELLLSGVRPEEIEAIKAEITKETAQLEYHKRQLTYTTLRAGISGRIVSGSLMFAVGDYLNKGDLLTTIEQTRTVLAEVKIPESDIDEVKVGSEVRIKAWAYPNREFYGVVRSVAPNAEESDYGKVVRVLSEIGNEEKLLKSELTGYGKVRGEEMPAAFAFTRMLVRFFRIELWSWLP